MYDANAGTNEPVKREYVANANMNLFVNPSALSEKTSSAFESFADARKAERKLYMSLGAVLSCFERCRKESASDNSNQFTINDFLL